MNIQKKEFIIGFCLCCLFFFVTMSVWYGIIFYAKRFHKDSSEKKEIRLDQHQDDIYDENMSDINYRVHEKIKLINKNNFDAKIQKIDSTCNQKAIFYVQYPYHEYEKVYDLIDSYKNKYAIDVKRYCTDTTNQDMDVQYYVSIDILHETNNILIYHIVRERIIKQNESQKKDAVLIINKINNAQIDEENIFKDFDHYDEELIKYGKKNFLETESIIVPFLEKKNIVGFDGDNNMIIFVPMHYDDDMIRSKRILIPYNEIKDLLKPYFIELL